MQDVNPTVVCDIARKSFNYLNGKLNTVIPAKLVFSSGVVGDTVSFHMQRPNIITLHYKTYTDRFKKLNPKVKVSIFMDVADVLLSLDTQYNDNATKVATNPSSAARAESNRFFLTNIKEIEKVLNCQISKEIIMAMLDQFFSFDYKEELEHITVLEFIANNVFNICGFDTEALGDKCEEFKNHYTTIVNQMLSGKSDIKEFYFNINSNKLLLMNTEDEGLAVISPEPFIEFCNKNFYDAIYAHTFGPCKLDVDFRYYDDSETAELIFNSTPKENDDNGEE